MSMKWTLSSLSWVLADLHGTWPGLGWVVYQESFNFWKLATALKTTKVPIFQNARTTFTVACT